VEITLPEIAGLLVLLLLSGYFSTARAALSKARRYELRELAEDGDRRAWRALQAAEDSSRMLNTFALANLIVNSLIIGLSVAVTVPAAALWLETTFQWIGPGTSSLICAAAIVLAAAVVIYVLTEIVADALANRDAERWAMAMGGSAMLLITLFAPLVSLSGFMRRALARRDGHGSDSAQVTEEEIMTLVDAGEEEGSIEEEEKEMIYSIFQLDETLVREIMVPRIDIVAVEINASLEQALEIITAAGHSRIPVYEDSLDQIKGMLYAKDLLELLKTGAQGKDLRSLLREALFVPETKNVMDLLRELQTAKVHLAIAIDEYGGTAGLVTMEDIVEEIVGEIFDEYDGAAEALFEQLGDDEYLIDARIHLDDFNELLDVELTDELGDTLGGFIYGQLGKVPSEGEAIETSNLTIEVLSVIDRRIRKVRVRRTANETEPEAQNGKQHGNGNGR